MNSIGARIDGKRYPRTRAEYRRDSKRQMDQAVRTHKRNGNKTGLAGAMFRVMISRPSAMSMIVEHYERSLLERKAIAKHNKAKKVRRARTGRR